MPCASGLAGQLVANSGETVYQTDEIPAVFLMHSAGVLGDTSEGLSGAEIVRLCAAFALDANINIPYASYPFEGRMGINKRTALFENLKAFPTQWRYRIIRELCDHKTVQQSNTDEANKLKIQLFTRYGHLKDDATTTDLLLASHIRNSV